MGVRKYKKLPCQNLLGRVNSARIKLNATVHDFWCLSFCWSPSKGCNCIIKLKIDKGTFKSAPHLWFQLVTTYIVLFQNCSIPGTSFRADIVWLWACPSKFIICHLWLCHCLLLFSPQPESILQSRKTEIDQVVNTYEKFEDGINPLCLSLLEAWTRFTWVQVDLWNAKSL